jgi:hypothetical protein
MRSGQQENEPEGEQHDEACEIPRRHRRGIITRAAGGQPPLCVAFYFARSAISDVVSTLPA